MVGKAGRQADRQRSAMSSGRRWRCGQLRGSGTGRQQRGVHTGTLHAHTECPAQPSAAGHSNPAASSCWGRLRTAFPRSSASSQPPWRLVLCPQCAPWHPPWHPPLPSQIRGARRRPRPFHLSPDPLPLPPTHAVHPPALFTPALPAARSRSARRRPRRTRWRRRPPPRRAASPPRTSPRARARVVPRAPAAERSSCGRRQRHSGRGGARAKPCRRAVRRWDGRHAARAIAREQVQLAQLHVCVKGTMP